MLPHEEDFGTLFTVQEFWEMVGSGELIDYDGSGCWATATHYDLVSTVTPSEFDMDKIPAGISHVLWFNK